MFNDTSSPLNLLLSRRSGKPRDMVAPGPDAAQMGAILAAATRVPDHGKLAPWRFLLLAGADKADLADRLEALARPIDPGFGFDLIRLSVTVTQPLSALQPDFQGRALDEEALEALVDRLSTRLGRDRVSRFVAQDSHDPDRARRLHEETDSVHVREMTEFILAASDRSFLTPK